MLTSIDDATIRRALVRYVANEGRDRDASHEIYLDDAVLEFPQSGSDSSASGRSRTGGRSTRRRRSSTCAGSPVPGITGPSSC